MAAERHGLAREIDFFPTPLLKNRQEGRTSNVAICLQTVIDRARTAVCETGFVTVRGTERIKGLGPVSDMRASEASVTHYIM